MLCDRSLIQYSHLISSVASGSSIWTIDLAMLATDCGFNVEYYTKTLGVDSSYENQDYYVSSFSIDQIRVKKLFASSAPFKIHHCTLTTSELGSMLRQNLVIILLIDKNVLDCGRSTNFYGHYILLFHVNSDGVFSYFDPNASPEPLNIDSKQLDSVRCAHGTDQDILIIDPIARFPISLNSFGQTIVCETAKVHLVCHGQSEFNAHESLHEICDDPFLFDSGLTKLGIEQAQNLKSFFYDLKTPRILCSPSKCTLQTAIHAGISNASVNADCAEWLTESTDIGTKTSNLVEQFSQFDFSNLKDIWWYGNNNLNNDDEIRRQFTEFGLIEPHEHFCSRVLRIHESITSADDTFVIITHPDWIQYFLELSGIKCDRPIINGEVFHI